METQRKSGELFTGADTINTGRVAVVNILEHSGVKGMKWGKRKARASNKKSGSNLSGLTDAQLKAKVERLRLEQQYSELSGKSKKGKNYTETLLKNQGNIAVSAVTSAVVGAAVKKALSK